MRRFSRLGTVAVAAVGMCTALVMPGGAASAEPGDAVRIVATGFAGPLHVSVAPNGQIYVADASRARSSGSTPGEEA